MFQVPGWSFEMLSQWEVSKDHPKKKMDSGPDKNTILNYDQFCGPFDTLTLTQKANIICC